MQLDQDRLLRAVIGCRARIALRLIQPSRTDKVSMDLFGAPSLANGEQIQLSSTWQGKESRIWHRGSVWRGWDERKTLLRRLAALFRQGPSQTTPSLGAVASFDWRRATRHSASCILNRPLGDEARLGVVQLPPTNLFMCYTWLSTYSCHKMQWR
jgi:hypothetical protein